MSQYNLYTKLFPFDEDVILSGDPSVDDQKHEEAKTN